MSQLYEPGCLKFYKNILKIENRYNYVNVYLRNGQIWKIKNNDPKITIDFVINIAHPESKFIGIDENPDQ